MGVEPRTLIERPGAEHSTESGLGVVDHGVGVLLKTGLQGCLEVCDLAVGFPNDPHQCPNSRPEGVGDRRGCAEVSSAEAFLYFAGDRIEVAFPSAPFERSSDLRQRQAGAQGGDRCPTQYGHSVTTGQVPERFQRCRIVLAQGVADPVGVTHPRPDQVLMGSGHDLDTFRPGTVTSHPTVVVTVGAYQIS